MFRKVVGIVGYKNSGKTTLTRALAQELSDRGHVVAVVKHTSHDLDVPGKDTAVLGTSASQVALVSSHESALFWKRPLSLEDVIPHLEADLILVEGFKAQRTWPKIACLRGEPDDGDLFDGLLICAVGPGEILGELSVPALDDAGIPLFSWDEVSQIADLAERNAFKLPNLDCGDCGRARCYDLAREIVAGTGTLEDCVPAGRERGIEKTTRVRS